MTFLTILSGQYTLGRTQFKSTSKKKVLDMLKTKLLGSPNSEIHGISFDVYNNKRYTLICGEKEPNPFDGWLIRYREMTHTEDIVKDSVKFDYRLDAIKHFLKLCNQKGDHWD
jgi:hypothetical protein